MEDTTVISLLMETYIFLLLPTNNKEPGSSSWLQAQPDQVLRQMQLEYLTILVPLSSVDLILRKALLHDGEVRPQ